MCTYKSNWSLEESSWMIYCDGLVEFKALGFPAGGSMLVSWSQALSKPLLTGLVQQLGRVVEANEQRCHNISNCCSSDLTAPLFSLWFGEVKLPLDQSYFQTQNEIERERKKEREWEGGRGRNRAVQCGEKGSAQGMEWDAVWKIPPIRSDTLDGLRA